MVNTLDANASNRKLAISVYILVVIFDLLLSRLLMRFLDISGYPGQNDSDDLLGIGVSTIYSSAYRACEIYILALIFSIDSFSFRALKMDLLIALDAFIKFLYVSPILLIYSSFGLVVYALLRSYGIVSDVIYLSLFIILLCYYISLFFLAKIFYFNCIGKVATIVKMVLFLITVFSMDFILFSPLRIHINDFFGLV